MRLIVPANAGDPLAVQAPVPCTNDISIEFEIRPKFVVLWFKMYPTDHNGILHTPRQCNCRGMRQISL